MEQIFKKLKGVILVKADFYKIKKKNVVHGNQLLQIF